MSSTLALDIEAQAVHKPNQQKHYRFPRPVWVLKAKKIWFSKNASKAVKAPIRWIEDFPQGYPRFSALIGQDVGFAISRRFSIVRTRLLLKKQDKVWQLEQQLEELDKNEVRPLFLASIRRDKNTDRETVLRDLDAALADYDTLLERNARIAHLPAPARRHTTSLSNWLENTGSICRKETSFLQESDLCTIASIGDDGLARIENFVELLFVWFLSRCGISPPSTVSKDPRIFVFKGHSLRVATRLLAIWMIIALLLVPVVVMRVIRNPALQIFCVLVASGCFVLVLSTVVKARTTDIFIAGPTYAALLVVFIVTKGSDL